MDPDSLRPAPHNLGSVTLYEVLCEENRVTHTFRKLLFYPWILDKYAVESF